MAEYRYASLMRPPSPGAYPRRGLREVSFDEGAAPSGHHHWGVLTYDRELTVDEVWSYELERLPQEDK